MRNRASKTPHRGAATKHCGAAKHCGATTGTLVRTTLAVMMTLAMALSAGSAFAAEDDEDLPLDTKLFRQLMKDLGLRRDGEGIDYRERAPLVVPPSRNLPPPRNEAAVTSNPAWPNDPDVKQRKQEAVKKKQPNRTAAEAADAEARPLSRSELERGRTTAGTPQAGGTIVNDADAEASRPLRPTELGSKSLFSNMFSSAPWADKTETSTFTTEPPRDNLTAPPPGYQTPSPNQPYGLGKSQEKGRAKTFEERTAGETR